MMVYTKSDIKDLVDENDVKFLRLQFTDILGTIKNVAIPVDQLDKALEGEIMFDGSSIEGFVRIEESDMLLKPDLNTFTLFPWKPEDGAEARLICDVYNPDGTPFEGCPRWTLKTILEEARKLGYTCNVGPEPEFYLFLRDGKGNPTIESHDQASYFDLSPIDKGEEARRDMVLTLEEMGFEIEASHHEVGPGQHEIDFKYADALTTADNIATFRLVVRTVAKRHDLHATFMPKPRRGIPGSGMHCHQSLFKEGKNAFYDPQGERQLSKDCYHYLAGVLHHAPATAAITNPLVNSYKRLVPGFEAPVHIAWSEKNRSPLIRVPARRGIGTRLEVRHPDPSCNPYLALAVMLKAGLHGIKEQMEPPKPVNKNIYNMSASQRTQHEIQPLPANINDAVEALNEDPVIKEVLGQHILEHFVEAKKIEWQNYNTEVHDWEIDTYLRKF